MLGGMARTRLVAKHQCTHSGGAADTRTPRGQHRRTTEAVWDAVIEVELESVALPLPEIDDVALPLLDSVGDGETESDPLGETLADTDPVPVFDGEAPTEVDCGGEGEATWTTQEQRSGRRCKISIARCPAPICRGERSLASTGGPLARCNCAASPAGCRSALHPALTTEGVLDRLPVDVCRQKQRMRGRIAHACWCHRHSRQRRPPAPLAAVLAPCSRVGVKQKHCA